MAEKKEVLAFVKFEDSHYWTKTRICNIEFVTRTDDNSRLEPSYTALDHLIVRAQLTTEYAVDGFYGYSLNARNLDGASYEVLEQTAKVMRQVEKKMAAMNEKFGWVNSFGEWVVRLCDILKVENQVKTSRYSDQWVLSGIGDLRYSIEQSAREFADSLKVAA